MFKLFSVGFRLARCGANSTQNLSINGPDITPTFSTMKTSTTICRNQYRTWFSSRKGDLNSRESKAGCLEGVYSLNIIQTSVSQRQVKPKRIGDYHHGCIPSRIKSLSATTETGTSGREIKRGAIWNRLILARNSSSTSTRLDTPNNIPP